MWVNVLHYGWGLQTIALTEGNEVDEEDLVRQRHELEVRELDDRPDHPVLGQRVEVGALQLLARVRSLEQCHGAQEAEQVGAGEHGLVGQDARDDLGIGTAGDDDLLLQEAKPLGGSRTEDATAVEDHATGASHVMVLETLLFNELLCHGVAGREEDASGDGLSEDRARGQLGLVPVGAFISDCMV